MNNIFKKSFIEGFGSTSLSTYEISVAILITCVLALYVFVVYRVMTKKTFYSKSFNISLAAISIITAGIILTVQSSIVVSLGMVGALSIVRFRTAIKDPMDLIFLFWAIAIGIICGAGLAQVAVIVSLAVTFMVLILDKLPIAKAPMILVVNSSDINGEKLIMEEISKYAKHTNIKSRNLTDDGLNMIIELRCDKYSELVTSVKSIQIVRSVSLLAHDGEVTF